MRLLFTDIRNAIYDINYDNAEVVIQELSTTYTESSKLAYCLEINGHRLQVVSKDKEAIEEIAKYIRVTAADYVGKFCYCDMDNVIKIMANGAKKSTNKDYTYNKYILEKKHQIKLDGVSFKQEPEKAVKHMETEGKTEAQANISSKTLQEALIQANNELRRFIPKK